MNSAAKAGSFAEHVGHRCLLNPHQRAVGERRGRRDALRLPGQASLPKEGLSPEEGNHRFFAPRGDNGELHLSALDVEDGVGDIALHKDRAVLSVGRDGFPGPDVGEEGVGDRTSPGEVIPTPLPECWVGRASASPCILALCWQRKAVPPPSSFPGIPSSVTRANAGTHGLDPCQPRNGCRLPLAPLQAAVRRAKGASIGCGASDVLPEPASRSRICAYAANADGRGSPPLHRPARAAQSVTDPLTGCGDRCIFGKNALKLAPANPAIAQQHAWLVRHISVLNSPGSRALPCSRRKPDHRRWTPPGLAAGPRSRRFAGHALGGPRGGADGSPCRHSPDSSDDRPAAAPRPAAAYRPALLGWRRRSPVACLRPFVLLPTDGTRTDPARTAAGSVPSWDRQRPRPTPGRQPGTEQCNLDRDTRSISHISPPSFSVWAVFSSPPYPPRLSSWRHRASGIFSAISSRRAVCSLFSSW